MRDIKAFFLKKKLCYLMLHGKHLIPNLFVLWHVNPNILFLIFCYVQKSEFMKDIQAKSGLSGIYRHPNNSMEPKYVFHCMSDPAMQNSKQPVL